jgi:IMP dehydrogenase
VVSCILSESPAVSPGGVCGSLPVGATLPGLRVFSAMIGEDMGPVPGGSASGLVIDEPLTTVRNIMLAPPLSIPASETVGPAIELLRQHKLPGIPVVEDGRVVGIVTPLQLLRQPLYRPVSEVMSREVDPAAPELSLVQAHLLFTRQRLDVLPVVEDGRLLGVISLTALLEAKAQEVDPLTGLSWSTALRAWAGSSLAGGNEVAILFVDLDNFHMVNRALGHVVGDDVLRSVARRLSELVDPATDILCRYGGDEFAIATTRGGAEVGALAQRIREEVSVPVEMDGTTRTVTVSVGVAGGRRVEKRASQHIAATVEDLLTLASRGSTLAKDSHLGVVHHTQSAEEESRRSAHVVPEEGEARLRLVGVTITTAGGRSTASVELGLGPQTGAGTATGRTHGRGVSFLVAEATLHAITQILGDDHAFSLEDLAEIPDPEGALIIVILSAESGTPDQFVGGARGRDLPYVVPKAILSALNRRLAKPAGEVLRRVTAR